MLGVCYYPEQWPESLWNEDARRMAELGLKYVRIGEFAWSAIEPDPGRFVWDWLDRAVNVLGKAGLQIVMGTPTATPPKWLVDRSPDILPHDSRGRPRGFGSRRHYCFSSPTYRAESRRITEAVAARYGKHDAVAGWQTDNEYGCHDTVRSYSPNALAAFRDWLERRYGSIAALNEAWGNRFWSMEYRSFGEIDLPMGSVTELNPIHRLDFFRFSSDQVASFDAEQVAILRRLSSGRFVTHNFMGAFLDFDHFKVGEGLDFASWDSYPLGFTDSVPTTGFTEAERVRYATTGHPDISAFHHDLYRGAGHGRFWVMEQQPGPVNWALWNPSPSPGMIRLWTWEALAHGADVVSYFRWRQAPFAQEQMHAGLNRPDNVLDVGGREAHEVAGELKGDWWREAKAARASTQVAIVFDYEAAWMHEIQPQGRGFSYLALVFAWYTAIRKLGVDIDIVPPGASLKCYRAAFVPSLPHVSEKALEAFAAFGGVTVFGIRTGAKTRDFQIPRTLPVGPLQSLLPVKVARVESLRPHVTRALSWGNKQFSCGAWAETIEASGEIETLASFANGAPALVRKDRRVYLAAWPSRELASAVTQFALDEAGVESLALPEDVRVRRRGGITFAFNYGSDSASAPSKASARYVLGAQMIGAHNLSAWKN